MTGSLGRGPRNPDRSFGVSVGSAMCMAALLLAWRGRWEPAWMIGPAGLLLAACGLVRPGLLARPSAVWWRAVHLLGYVNARIVLTLLFVGGLVPLGLILRLVGHDPLSRRKGAFGGWSPSPTRYRDPRHYRRMY